MQINYSEQLREAVKQFWVTRSSQADKQGEKTGQKDAGARYAVPGSAQMDGLVKLVWQALVSTGLSRDSIFFEKKIELPGYFRPEKQWDLLVVIEECLVCAIEFKNEMTPGLRVMVAAPGPSACVRIRASEGPGLWRYDRIPFFLPWNPNSSGSVSDRRF
jgi:hypothetical protein